MEANNIDYFISVHSNANSEGSTANFPLMLYRGPDKYSGANSTDGAEYVEGSYEKAKLANEEKLKIMKAGIDVPSSTNLNIRGDWNFYGSTSTLTINGKTYKGYLGVMKHGASGFLSEGYFHTYQPARHRAMNFDVDRLEGVDYARGVADYFGWEKESYGAIYGVVRDKNVKFSDAVYTPKGGTPDVYKPLNDVDVTLKDSEGNVVDTYKTDVNYNGAFVFMNVDAGDYTVEFSHPDYQNAEPIAVSVESAKTSYPTAFLENTSSVEGIAIDETDEPASFYNLQGIKVANPSNGVFIKVQGEKATKVNIK